MGSPLPPAVRQAQGIRARGHQSSIAAARGLQHQRPRAGTADEVAQGILFVIKNNFVTGTTVDVDGGWLLQEL